MIFLRFGPRCMRFRTSRCVQWVLVSFSVHTWTGTRRWWFVRRSRFADSLSRDCSFHSRSNWPEISEDKEKVQKVPFLVQKNGNAKSQTEQQKVKPSFLVFVSLVSSFVLFSQPFIEFETENAQTINSNGFQRVFFVTNCFDLAKRAEQLFFGNSQRPQTPLKLVTECSVKGGGFSFGLLLLTFYFKGGTGFSSLHADQVHVLHHAFRYTFYIMNVILPSLMTSVLLLSIFFCTPAQKVRLCACSG